VSQCLCVSHCACLYVSLYFLSVFVSLCQCLSLSLAKKISSLILRVPGLLKFSVVSPSVFSFQIV